MRSPPDWRKHPRWRSWRMGCLRSESWPSFSSLERTMRIHVSITQASIKSLRVASLKAYMQPYLVTLSCWEEECDEETRELRPWEGRRVKKHGQGPLESPQAANHGNDSWPYDLTLFWCDLLSIVLWTAWKCMSPDDGETLSEGICRWGSFPPEWCPFVEDQSGGIKVCSGEKF